MQRPGVRVRERAVVRARRLTGQGVDRRDQRRGEARAADLEPARLPL